MEELPGSVGLDVILSQRSYFAGDAVRCRVYVYFPSGGCMLEWASAQVHGHVAFDPHLVSPGDADHVEAAGVKLDFEARERQLRLLEMHNVPDEGQDGRRGSGSGQDAGLNGVQGDISRGPVGPLRKSAILHRAEDSMQVLRKSGSFTQVGRKQLVLSSSEIGLSGNGVGAGATASFSSAKSSMSMSGKRRRGGFFGRPKEMPQSFDSYDETLEFLSHASNFATQSMPDVTLLAGKYGNCLFASPPEVMACALEGKAGREVAFAYEARLPDELPPSYLGTAARYFFVLSIGAKLDCNETAQVLHIPLRICSTIQSDDDLESLASRASSPLGSEKGDRLRSFSSFLLEEHNFHVRSWMLGQTNHRRKPSHCSSLDAFTVACDDLPLAINRRGNSFKVVDFDSTGSAQRESTAHEEHVDSGATHSRIPSTSDHGSGSAKVFRIGSEAQHMAHLHIFKEFVRPGEQFLLSFGFTEADIQTYQITIGFEIEEQSKCPAALQAALDPLTDAHGFGMGPWQRVLLSNTVLVPNHLEKSIILTVPVDATPDFETDLIRVRTYLRFEFVTAVKKMHAENENGDSGDITHNPITNSKTQISPWRIPLKVLPPINRKETISLEDENDKLSPIQDHEGDSGVLLLSSSTQASMLHIRAWL